MQPRRQATWVRRAGLAGQARVEVLAGMNRVGAGAGSKICEVTMMRAAAMVMAIVAVGWAQAPSLPEGVSREQLVDNDSVLVARLAFEPGAREQVHTHPFSAVVVQVTAGQVDMAIGADKTKGAREPGAAWFLPREVPHAAANVGPTPLRVVTVALKPTRRPAPPMAAATTPAPAAAAPFKTVRLLIAILVPPGRCVA